MYSQVVRSARQAMKASLWWTPASVAKNAATVAAGFYDQGSAGARMRSKHGRPIVGQWPRNGYGWLEWAWPAGRRYPGGVVVLPLAGCSSCADSGVGGGPVDSGRRRLVPLRSGAAASDVWAAAVLVLAAELAFEVVRTVIVDHHMGVDTIALVAMVGALALGEEFAGVIIGLMFSGGADAGGHRVDTRSA